MKLASNFTWLYYLTLVIESTAWHEIMTIDFNKHHNICVYVSLIIKSLNWKRSMAWNNDDWFQSSITIFVYVSLIISKWCILRHKHFNLKKWISWSFIKSVVKMILVHLCSLYWIYAFLYSLHTLISLLFCFSTLPPLISFYIITR